MRPLLGLPEIPDTLDDAALADTLILDNGPAERTLYRAIKRVPMAHILIIERGGERARRYWTQPTPGTLRLANDSAYEEAAREVIDRSVADALRSHGPPSLSLTGGLDTVTVAESAIRQSAPRRLLAMTRVPSGPIPGTCERRYYDESGLVKELVAMMPGLDWHPVPDDGGDWGEHDERNFLLHGGIPSRAAHNIAWFYPLYRFMATRGSRVILGGEMGNAFYSAAGTEHLPRMLMQGRWATVAREVRRLARTEGASWTRTALRHVARPLAPLRWHQRRDRAFSTPWIRHSALHPDVAVRLNLADTLDRSRYRMRVGASHGDPMALRDWMLGDEVARDGFGTMRAMNGVDQRAPLIDRRVVEFFGALPADQFLRNGITRSIARRTLAGRVPDAIANGARRGVQNGDWFHLLTSRRAALIEEVEQLQAQGIAGRIIDLDRILDLLHDWPRDAEAAERRRSEYLQLLTRGISMARFLAWHARAN
jgi:asparagine synthase (glutamine-hydrolysing)